MQIAAVKLIKTIVLLKKGAQINMSILFWKKNIVVTSHIHSLVTYHTNGIFFTVEVLYPPCSGGHNFF